MAKITLEKVGRAKVDKTFEVDNSTANYSEEDLAEIALREVRKHVMSSEVWLEPDDVKGDGHWKVHVGMGYHVGNVQIKA